MTRLLDAEEIAIDIPVEKTQVIRLAGIDAARASAPQTADAGATAPLLEAAQQLMATFSGQRLCLQRAGTLDRYGRLPAHIVADDGRWLQGELLARGLARVRTTPDATARVFEMLALEEQARAAGVGLWREPEFGVLSPERAGSRIGSFGLVEGKVVTAARRKDTWYLNFGSDWRSDFTIAIPVKRLPAGELAALDPYALQGQRVRVRGWLESYNGPMIELTHLEQLERLQQPASGNGH